jgi:tRNA U55 pseudouridine synthase TruB
MSDLRRTAIGAFSIERAVQLQDIDFQAIENNLTQLP